MATIEGCGTVNDGGADMKQGDEEILSLPDKLKPSGKILRDFHVQCFWYLREELELKPSDLDEIVRGLRQNGGRRGLLLAAKLCR